MAHARRAHPALWTTILLAAGLAAGCNLGLRKETRAPDGGAAPDKPGVGGACTTDASCRTGLACMATVCRPPGNRPENGPCTLSAECMAGLYCSIDGLCAKSGTGVEGGECTLERDCGPGLICNFQGLSGACAKAGNGDVGAMCGKSTDCMAGLVCTLGKCQTFDSIEPWQGAVCPEPTTGGMPRAFFKVPRGSDTGQDFYALPFPNDIRLVGGKVSLTGHPSPGARYLPVDPVQSYISLAEQDLAGWGVNTAAYFRFSRNPRADTVTAANIQLVNVTPGSPELNMMREVVIEVKTAKSFYVCAPYVVVRPRFGNPLRAGETYAIVLKRGIVDEGGMAFERDDDFGLMVQPAPPGIPLLNTAWTAYAPLRTWAAAQRIDVNTLVNAAVFTTQKLEDPIKALREAVRAAPAPMVKGLVKCAAGVKSPCEDATQGAERRCVEAPASASYDEYQGRLSIPVFQAGKKPFETAADGGGITFDATGKAMAAASEDVCFTLTVPRGAAPGAGWPVVIYAHGTGGSYRSHVDSGLAEDYAKGTLADGAAAPMAVFGYDGALHADRRGGSARSPDHLVYNFINARGARDTSLQAGADLFVIARALETWSAASGVTLNPARIAMYGHSQGGNAAALAVPYEPAIGAAVLSGTGGTLTLSLLAKKQPVDIAAAVPLLLGDPKVDEHHPVLNILQMYFDRSDGVNFGRRLFVEPPAGVTPHSALHVFGADDTYSPRLTQRTYGQAARFPALMSPVAPIHDDRPDLMKVGPPVKGNVNNGMTTAVQAQFRPAGKDGHFVSTDIPDARRLIQQMLGTFARDGLPTVGP